MRIRQAIETLSKDDILRALENTYSSHDFLVKLKLDNILSRFRNKRYNDMFQEKFGIDVIQCIKDNVNGRIQSNIDEKMDKTRICEMCGKEYTMRSGGSERFCSTVCHCTYSSNSNKEVRREKISQINKKKVEDGTYIVGRDENGNLVTLAQYKEEYNKHKSTCVMCGKELEYENRNKRFCDECVKKLPKPNKQRVSRKGYHKKSHKKGIIRQVQVLNKCVICGKEFYSGRKYKTCSPKCHHENLVQQGKRIYKMLVETGKFVGYTKRPIASFAEKFWMEVLNNNNIPFEFNFYINKRRDLGVDEDFGYFLDFKIGNNIDLEIDGKQHKVFKDRIEKDKHRDELLTNAGWKVYRIDFNEIRTEEGKQLMKNKIYDFLDWYHNHSLKLYKNI